MGARRDGVVRIATAVLAFAATAAHAKCASVSITIHGRVTAPVADTRVRIEMSPGARLGGHPILVSPDDTGMFSVTTWYDTFNGGGLFGSGLFHHDCSRRPRTVELSLMAGDGVLGRTELDVARDFDVDALDDRIKQPVMLSAPPD